MGENTIWFKMVELTFEKRLMTGFIVMNQPSSLVRLKKGKKKNSHEVFRKENFIRCFQLEIGDVIS